MSTSCPDCKEPIYKDQKGAWQSERRRVQGSAPAGMTERRASVKPAAPPAPEKAPRRVHWLNRKWLGLIGE